MKRRGNYRKFTPEFKAEAVRLVLESPDSRKAIARDLGVNPSTLQSWMESTRRPPAPPVIEDERSELLRLRRDIKRVEMERDILKKAMAAPRRIASLAGARDGDAGSVIRSSL